MPAQTYPEQYLHVTENRSGETFLMPLRSNSLLDLPTQVRKWVRREFAGELFLDGKMQPSFAGDYFAKIMTDGRPPDSVCCWTSGGFYLTPEPCAFLRETFKRGAK